MITVFAAVVFSSQAIAEASSLTPNYSQAKTAAGRLLKTIDEVGSARERGAASPTSPQPLSADSVFPRGASPSAPPSPNSPKFLSGSVSSPPSFLNAPNHPLTNRNSLSVVYEKIDSFTSLPPPDLIAFHSVRFAYPNRPKSRVLRGFSLHIKAGQNVALVGPSGCGKSTVVQLLVRFYDPADGFVTYDGDDLRGLDLGLLRQRIAYVQQDPFLFAGSILDNLCYGLTESEIAVLRRERLVEKILKIVQMADFVRRQPAGLGYQVGPKGHALSGGQRQRVALGRALLRRPRVLILDEATSALDSATESALLTALDEFARATGMARIVIAHRLSTVKESDVIAVLNEGRVRQLGDHAQLVADKDGLYYRMCHSHQYRFVD